MRDNKVKLATESQVLILKLVNQEIHVFFFLFSFAKQHHFLTLNLHVIVFALAFVDYPKFQIKAHKRLKMNAF